MPVEQSMRGSGVFIVVQGHDRRLGRLQEGEKKKKQQWQKVPCFARNIWDSHRAYIRTAGLYGATLV